MHLEDLLAHVDLPRLVEETGVRLRRVGHGQYRSACPLHRGMNPTSFQLYLTNGKWRWRCWSDCSTGGDAVDFVQRWKGVSFLDAVQFLAEQEKVSLEPHFPEYKKQMMERKLHRELLDLAARFAAERLWSNEGKQALEYARSRGFSDQTIRLAGLGWLDGSTALYDYLHKCGADIALADQMGLIRRDRRDFTANSHGRDVSPAGYLIYAHRPYPQAQRRPCAVCQGETWQVGKTCLSHAVSWEHLCGVEYLSARAIHPVDPHDKARNLPGPRKLYKAESFKDDAVILVEGQADAESYRQLGFSAWALCGLSKIPDSDLAELQNRKAVYLALDSDAAGQGTRLEQIATQLGPLVLIVPPFEAGSGIKDANEWLQAGATPAQVVTQLQHARTWFDLQLERLSQAQPHEAQKITRQLLRSCQSLPQELAPGYLQKLQRRLGIGRKELRQWIAEITASDNGDFAQPSLASIQKGCLIFAGETLANFWAVIEKELILDDGQNTPELHYTVRGELANGAALPKVEITAEEFTSLTWIHKYWGARPILYIPLSKRHLFLRAVQELSTKRMERERIYTHTGWTVLDNQRGFLSSGGLITANGYDSTVRVELDPHLQCYRLPAPPTGSTLIAAVQASLGFLEVGPLTVTAPLWAAMYAAPLTSILPLNALLWVYGTTQSGKSTIVHLALTHFGATFIEGRLYHAPTDWLSTQAHLEESMFVLKDVPLVIDDFAPQFHSHQESQRMKSAAATLARSIGNRSARGRSRKYQARTLIPRGLVISTSELPLVGQSTVGRMLYIPVARGDILPDNGERSRPKLDAAQRLAQGGVYAQAMSAYLRYLAERWDTVVASAQSLREESLRYIRERYNLQNRLPDYFATLDTAQRIALSAFVEMGALSPSEADERSQQMRAALCHGVVSQDEKINAESPVRKFFEALNSLLEHRKVYIAPRTKEYVYEPPHGAELIGWTNPNEYQLYLDDSICLAQARLYWAAQGEHFDLTIDALRRQISQVPGLLAERGEGYNLSVSKWLAGKNRRALSISKRGVQELYGFDLRNEPL